MRSEMKLNRDQRKAYLALQDTAKAVSKIPLGLPLIWVYVWVVILGFKDDTELIVNATDKEIFAALYRDADKEGFTIEYGSESLVEHLREWMVESDLMEEINCTCGS